MKDSPQRFFTADLGRTTGVPDLQHTKWSHVEPAKSKPVSHVDTYLSKPSPMDLPHVPHSSPVQVPSVASFTMKPAPAGKERLKSTSQTDPKEYEDNFFQEIGLYKPEDDEYTLVTGRGKGKKRKQRQKRRGGGALIEAFMKRVSRMTGFAGEAKEYDGGKSMQDEVLDKLYAKAAGRFSWLDPQEELEKKERLAFEQKEVHQQIENSKKYIDRLFDFKNKNLNANHRVMKLWDLQILLLLLYAAIATPYEVALLHTPGMGFRLIVNLYIDSCFFIDMLSNFFLPYYDSHGHLIRNHVLIGRRYMNGWFWPDLVSIIPFDLIVYLGGDGVWGSLVFFRVLRLLRLIKMVALVRSIRLFQRWEARMFVNYALLNLIVLLVGVVFCAHWLACLWALLIHLDPDASWGATFYLIRDDSPAIDCYLACIYWSMGLVTGMGHSGDSINVNTQVLRSWYVFIMAVAGVSNAYLIGGVVSLLERMNERRSAFYRDMDILNGFLRSRRIMEGDADMDGRIMPGHMLCEKLRTYYIFKHSQGSLAENFQKILFTCSSSMQNAIAGKMHADALFSIPFFKNANRKFITKISTAIQTQIFAAHEQIFSTNDESDRIYIIETGSVFCKGKLLHKHDTFGEEVFYSEGRRGYVAYSLTESVLLTIDRQHLKLAVESSGGFMMRLRMRVISTILKMQKTTRRAAVITMNRRTFLAGYEVLEMEYGSELLERSESPIISLWKQKVDHCMTELHHGGASLAPLPCGHSLEPPPDGEDNPSARGTVLLLTDYDFSKPISSEKLAKMRDVAAEYFDSLERRAKLKESVKIDRRDKESPLEQFLATPSNFDGQIMSQYYGLMSETHMLTLASLHQASILELMQMGIPWGDCDKLKQGCKKQGLLGEGPLVKKGALSPLPELDLNRESGRLKMESLLVSRGNTPSSPLPFPIPEEPSESSSMELHALKRENATLKQLLTAHGTRDASADPGRAAATSSLESRVDQLQTEVAGLSSKLDLILSRLPPVQSAQDPVPTPPPMSANARPSTPHDLEPHPPVLPAAHPQAPRNHPSSTNHAGATPPIPRTVEPP